MKLKHIIAHMKSAYIYSDCSYCVKLKVGAMVVKNNTPIAIGYNGTPSGDENVCELPCGKTKDNVIHAEDNALRKLVRSSESSIDSVLFTTHSTCNRCAQLVIDAGITTVYFSELYRDGDGVKLLIKHKIVVYQVNIEDGAISLGIAIDNKLIFKKEHHV